ncbi:MAG: hypothetical protein P1U58_15395 [Verrucomicrobiales bacterium]|nr:hypothetical protein [Verrucomicrobiales bacterium]
MLKSEFEITHYWVEGIAKIYGAAKDGWSKPKEVYEPKSQRPFRRLLKAISSGREVDTVEVFEELERCLRRELDSLRPETDLIKAVPAPPRGPLRSYLMEKLASKFPEKLIEKSALSSCLFGSSFVLQVESGKSECEFQQATLLPPERWFETSLIQSVNRKMANPFLAVHPNTLRTRSLLCEEDFTLVVSDITYGIALPSLIQLKGGLESDEVLRLGKKISQALAQFGSAELPFEIDSPWQIEVYLPMENELPNWNDLVSLPSSEWPAWEIRIRVEIPSEYVIEIGDDNAWSFTLAKLNGKSFPALIAWMNEWRRLEWAGKEQSLEREPISWDSRIDSLFEASCDYFEPSNPLHRERLINLLEECLNSATP